MNDNRASKPTPITTVGVPAFLVAALKRANFHLMDLLDYSKLRQIASLEDIAVFARIHNQLAVGGYCVTSLGLQHLMKNLTASSTEVSYCFDRLMATPEIRDIAANRLAPLPAQHQQLFRMPLDKAAAQVVPDGTLKTSLAQGERAACDTAYQLKTSGATVFVVVDHGFSKYVEADSRSDDVKLFVRDFIQLCDSLFSPAEVAQHPLFESFLNS